ncbi:uncharacterized protein LOC135837565 [Planococcus citri]|uniref:uncharacterized protein LOC135837565 n=1 Tax=Planococcus citri TaxID=170843 RepID=UPI0031F98E86
MGDIEEYPFSFMNTPASLQLLASSEVALMLWQYKYSNLNDDDISLGLFLEQTFSCDEMLVIPSRFKAEIDERIVTIRQELTSWIEFHRRYKLIDADSRGDFSSRFKHIVVNGSGRIDYKATAVNILNSVDLSDDLVSYRMACLFCLEDQIKQIWPSVAEDLRLNGIANPNPNNYEYEYDSVFYWTRRMKSGDDSIHHAEFSVLRMLYRVLPNYPAFEYFWKLLPDDQRIPVVIESLVNGSYRITRISLPTLNRIQALKVFQDATSDLLDYLLLPESDDDYLPHMYQLWTAMKNKVLYKKVCFSDIVCGLWCYAFYTIYTGRRLNYARCDQINDVLLQIWSSTEDELKDYVVSNTRFTDIRHFFDRLVDRSAANNFCCYGHNAIFMSDLLKRSKNLDKEQFWQEYWRTLALLVKPSCLERLMRLCLPNDDAIEVFKSQLADFKDLFRSLINEGFYSHLKDFLLFCSKDAEQFQWLAKDMLEWNLDVILLHDDDKFAEFDWFVKELFSNVEKDADEFKAQIISSFDGQKFLFSARYADGTRLSDFGSIIGRFASNEQQLCLVKSKVWAEWKWKIETAHVLQFYTDQWQCFLEWCAFDSEELEAFKSSLNLDGIFNTRLSDYFEDFGANEVLEFLDAFLKWYFTDEEDAKNFKRDKIKNYEQIDEFCAKLESNDDQDRYLMNELLRWFLRW